MKWMSIFLVVIMIFSCFAFTGCQSTQSKKKNDMTVADFLSQEKPR